MLAPTGEFEPAFEHQPEDEVAAAVAGLRGELGGTEVGAVNVDEYRGALRNQTAARGRPSGLESLSTQVRIGLAVAGAIVLLVAALVFLPRLLTHRPQPVATTAASHPSTAPSAQASPAVAAAPSPQVSAAPVVPPLSGVVTAGNAGTAYQVLRIRTRNPSAGLNLIVFDLQGSGPLPDFQLGQAGDNTLYLQSAGTTIDPAIATAFQGTGPVSSIAPTGGDATSIKLTTSRAARYTIYYLTGPARLVIELR